MDKKQTKIKTTDDGLNTKPANCGYTVLATVFENSNMKQPKIVRKLTTLCNGWLVGSSALEGNDDPRDYDVFIPIEYWQQASSYITDDVKINTFGGFKVICDGKEVDIWTGKMEDILASNYFKAAYHPKTGVRVVRV